MLEILAAVITVLGGVWGWAQFWHLPRLLSDQPHDCPQLRADLAGGGWATWYRARLGRVLDRLDARWGARPFSAKLLDDTLLWAVAYPFLSILVIWIVTGAAGRVGTLVVIPESQGWWQQAAVAMAMLGLGLYLRHDGQIREWLGRQLIRLIPLRWTGKGLELLAVAVAVAVAVAGAVAVLVFYDALLRRSDRYQLVNRLIYVLFCSFYCSLPFIWAENAAPRQIRLSSFLAFCLC